MTDFIQNILTGLTAFAGFEFLVNITVKVSLIISLAGLIVFLLRHASAAIRHWIWSSAILCILIILALPQFVQERPLYLLPTISNHSLTEKPVKAKNFSKSLSNIIKKEDISARQGSFQPESIEIANNKSSLKAVQNTVSTIASSKLAHDSKTFLFTWPVALLLIWEIGIIIFLAKLLVEMCILFWISKWGNEVTANCWNNLLQQAQRKFRIKRSVKLIISACVSVPVTFGLLYPVIHLPQAARKWDIKKRNIILLHELAHIKRLDFAMNIVAQLVCALFWYNPLIWIAKRALNFEREQATDDCVIRLGVENCDYASHLVEIARAINPQKRIARQALAMAEKAALKKRLQNILGKNIRRYPLTRSVLLITALVVLLISIPFAVLHLQERIGNRKIQNSARLPILIEDLQNSDPEKQKMAAWALGEIKEQRAMSGST